MVSLPVHYGESFYLSSYPGEYCFLNLRGETSGNEVVESGNTVNLYNKISKKSITVTVTRKGLDNKIVAGIYPNFSEKISLNGQTVSISLLEDPNLQSEEAVTTQVALFSLLADGYLTVCESCNNLPGFSVDVHASTPSTTEGSIWTMITQPNGQIALQNTLTGTYLSACNGCNGLPGYSVDVHESNIGASSLWSVSTVSGGSTLESVQSGSLLRVCLGCIKEPNGYSVDVGASAPPTPSSTWQIRVLTPPPPPPGPNPTPTPVPLTPSTSMPSKPSWVLWLGVGLWVTGLIFWLALPEKLLAVRIIGALMSLAGIGVIFYAAF